MKEATIYITIHFIIKSV